MSLARILPLIAFLLVVPACQDEPEAQTDGGARLPDGPNACFSRFQGWAGCRDGVEGFPDCLSERLHELPGCRSQNDGRAGCRADVCEVDCGGPRCVGLPTCGGCDGDLCGIYDNAFVCRGGRWVEVADFGGHEDADLPPPRPEPDMSTDAAPDLDGGVRSGGPEHCYSRMQGWADCNREDGAFPWCAEDRWHDLPRCRSQNDGYEGCRSETCDVDCGGDRCVGLPTCGGCDGDLCGIYDNLFECQSGRWVELNDFNWHGDAHPPDAPSADAGAP